MTVRHLLADWGARLLPAPLARLGVRLARRAGLWDQIVSLNLGDIVAAIGRRAAAGDR